MALIALKQVWAEANTTLNITFERAWIVLEANLTLNGSKIEANQNLNGFQIEANQNLNR